MTVFLTGGTGFVGRSVTRRLIERGHAVRALTRDREGATGLRQLGADVVGGDITKEASLAGVVEGCDAAVHIVGIIREQPPVATFEGIHIRGTMNVLEAARKAKVGKFVHMSALGAKQEGTAYHRTKFEAEEIVRRSGIPYTIFRPPIIVGPGAGFISVLTRVLRYLPMTPVIGDGQYRLQPVDVEDVASAFAQAVEREDLKSETFEIGGPHKLTYNRILEIAAEEFGLRRSKVHVPVGLVRPLVDLVSNWRLPTPINSDELRMLLEENVVLNDANVLREVFGIDPTPFRAVLQRFSTARGSDGG